MKGYIQQVEIRWSDLDPNFHLRHSAYYDFGAYCRMAFLTGHGASAALFAQFKVGPILFREECVFKREINFGDVVHISLQLKKARPDMSRWTMYHEIWKQEEKLAAIIQVDGAWIDTVRRKLVTPPPFAHAVFEKFERTDDFEWL